MTSNLPAARRLSALRDSFDQSIGMEVAVANGQPVDLQVNAVQGLRLAPMLRLVTAQAACPEARLADGDDTVCLMVKGCGQMLLRQGRHESVPAIGDGVLLAYRQPSQLPFQAFTT